MAEDEHQLRGRDDRYEMGRVLALSDGIFAVAMTLLVVGIPVPQLTNPTDQDLQRELGNLGPNLFAFALSFAVIGQYWVNHRRLLKGVVRTDQPTVLLNLLLLLLVCLVPFSTALLSRYGNLASAVVVYASNVALIGLLLLALRLQTWRHLRTPPTVAQRRMAVVASLVVIVVFAGSIPIALYSPTYGKLAWLALVPFGFIVGRVDRARQLEADDRRTFTR